MKDNLFDLTGKVAIITGASRGIGLAVAESFASARAKVVLASRKQDALDRAAEKIQSQGGEAAHTGDPEAMWALASTCVEKYGGRGHPGQQRSYQSAFRTDPDFRGKSLRQDSRL